MSKLRAIRAISVGDLSPQKPATGVPICEMVDPATLFVDPEYQRDIGERGLRQIRRIVAGFDWSKFKPPICAFSDIEGKSVLKVLDGQHTAIAAASHPHIDMIPVMIVEAVDTTAQARAFIGQNVDRLAVTKLQLHQAAIAAGDEDALTVEQVCVRAGVTVLKHPGPNGKTKAGETVAITAIRALVDRHTAMRSRQILEVLAKAELAPITAPQIKAVEMLLTDPEYCESITPEDLTIAIVDTMLTADYEAKIFAASHKVPAWRGLAIVWFRKCKKRRLMIGKAA